MQRSSINFGKVRKGQISIFIIVGLILLIFAAILFVVLRPPSTEILSDDTQLVRNYVDQCIKSTAESGILLIGTQGGRIDLPLNYLSTYYSTIAYSYFDGNNLVPTLSDMENELDTYLEGAILLCVDNFTALKSQNIDVVDGPISVDVSINDLDVLVYVDYNILVNDASKLEEFSVTIPAQLAKVRAFSYDIVERIRQDPDYIDFTYLSEFDIPLEIIPHSENEIVISLTDTNSIISAEELIYLIAVKYIDNNAPELNFPASFELVDETPFAYQLDVKDSEQDSLTFEDDTAMFDIDELGWIRFTPRVTGSFNVTITVTDSHDNSNSKEVEFLVR